MKKKRELELRKEWESMLKMKKIGNTRWNKYVKKYEMWYEKKYDMRANMRSRRKAEQVEGTQLMQEIWEMAAN